MVTQIAGMGGAQLAVFLDVPFLKQVGQALVAVGDALDGRDAPEDLAVFFVTWVGDFDLVAQAAQEGFIDQVARGRLVEKTTRTSKGISSLRPV